MYQLYYSFLLLLSFALYEDLFPSVMLVWCQIPISTVKYMHCFTFPLTSGSQTLGAAPMEDSMGPATARQSAGKDKDLSQVRDLHCIHLDTM